MSSMRRSDGVEVGELRALIGMFSLTFGVVWLSDGQPMLGAMWFGSASLLGLWIGLQDHFIRLYSKRGYPKYDQERAKRDLNYYIDYVNGFALTPQLEGAARITQLFGALWIVSLLTVVALSVIHMAKS